MARPTSLGPAAGTGDIDVAVEYASLVYKYVKSAEELVGEIGRVDEASGVTAGNGDAEKETREEEDLKLLRLRTKKRELVIVPGKSPLVLLCFSIAYGWGDATDRS